MVDVLPVEPVMPTTRHPAPRSAAARRAPDRRARQADPRPRSRARRAPPPRPRRRRRAAARRSTPHAPCVDRARGEAAAVHAARPRSPTNRSPAATARESITARAGTSSACAGGAKPATRRPPAACAICPGVSRITCACPTADRSPRRASRATSRSSNGSLRPPSNSWPCSWPLPAITTMSPGPASCMARAMAARRSASTSIADESPGGASAAAPATIAAMIESGSSERGLSDVTTTWSARRRAAAPISGRLSRSRSPPAPNTTISRPSSSRPRADSSTFSSESGVCA